MNILNRILFLTIGNIINFLELNAMWNPNHHGYYNPNNDPENSRQHEAGEFIAMWDPNHHGYYQPNHEPQSSHQHGAGELNPSPQHWVDESSAMANFVPMTPRLDLNLDLNLAPFGSRRGSRQLNTMPEHHGANHLPDFENVPNPPRRRRNPAIPVPNPPIRLPDPHVEISYLNRIIHVVLKSGRDGNYEPKECIFAEGGSGFIPEPNYKLQHDYYVSAIYGWHENLKVKCVVYVRQNNFQNEVEIVGVTLPPKPGQSSDKSEYPNHLNPDESKWFITCMRLDFIVRQEGTVMRSVSLRIKKNRVPDPNEILSGGVYTFEVYVGGAHFLAFLRGDKAFGAMLLPTWWTPQIRAQVMALPTRSG